MKFMDSITQYTNVHHTDISSHLETIYKETYAMNPKVIVELGIRGAESSRIFSCITQELNARLIGVDIEPPHQFDYNTIKNGTLILMDDVKFASIYKALAKEVVDVLFIDTSHLYEHTVQEIAAWFPLLGNKALVIFHDTNLDGNGYYRKDGKMEMNWNNNRGVTRAIEEYLNIPIDEKTTFEKTVQRDDIKWTLKHYPNSNGLLLLWKN